MAPFGALKSFMLDHFGFKALYGGICWLKLSHVDSSWVDLGLSWSALGDHEGILRANMEATMLSGSATSENWGAPGRGRGGVNPFP